MKQTEGGRIAILIPPLAVERAERKKRFGHKHIYVPTSSSMDFRHIRMSFFISAFSVYL
jgi:hypothetical protein